MAHDPALDPQIAAARADLAKRLGIEATAPDLVLAERVTWPSTALGCPAPGGFYAQMLTEGARVHLRHGGRVYAYHSGPDGKPVYCSRPQTPAGGMATE